MANARDQMKILEADLERIRREIERLQIEEATVVRLLSKVRGEPEADKRRRVRSPSVKPLVLDILRQAGASGATTAEVDERVRVSIPSVAKDTVGSILSRLKSDGALLYVGDRYFERQFAPKSDPSPNLRAVN